jgi:hypothetical protein
MRLLLVTEAAIVLHASVHGLPRRRYLLYATSSRTTRKSRVAIVFRSQVHCDIMFRNAIPMPILQPPSANQMYRRYQLSASTVCLSGTLCGECALLLSVHSNSIPRISSVLPSQSKTLTLSAHRALSLGRVLLEPFDNAMLFPISFDPATRPAHY